MPKETHTTSIRRYTLILGPPILCRLISQGLCTLQRLLVLAAEGRESARVRQEGSEWRKEGGGMYCVRTRLLRGIRRGPQCLPSEHKTFQRE